MPRVRNIAHTAAAKHWKIGIYIRLSREDKEKEEGRGSKMQGKSGKRNFLKNAAADASGSIIEQDKILTEWVEEYFCEEPYDVVGYFIDDGLTGTDDARDDFRRLIAAAETGKINCIVVKTLSRAFRNYADQGRYLEQMFPRLGVRFISTSNPFVDSWNDPDAISNGLEIPINGLMNDRFAAKTSADIRRTFDAKRRRGEFIGAFAPYGYRKDPEDKNSLLIDEAAAQHVRDIFNWFVLDGMSKRAIALKLNELGVLNPTAYKQQIQKSKYQNPGTAANDGLWAGNNISNILKNEMYIGNMVQGRTRVISYKVHTQVHVAPEGWQVVPGTHEAIIDRGLFERAQLLHSHDTRTAPGKNEVYLFSGLLRCSDCKKAMRRKTAKHLVYYHCRTVQDKGSCAKRAIREDKIITAVRDAIRIQVKLLRSLSDVLDAIHQCPSGKTPSARLGRVLKSRQADLAKVMNGSDSLYLDWKNGDIKEADYRRMKASFDEKADGLNKIVKHVEDEINRLAGGTEPANPYLAKFLKQREIMEINRGIVVGLIDGIYIHAGGQITIHFAFADEVKGALGFTRPSATVVYQ